MRKHKAVTLHAEATTGRLNKLTIDSNNWQITYDANGQIMGVMIDGKTKDFPDNSTIIRTIFEFNAIWSAQLLSTANLIANLNSNTNKVVSSSQGIQLIQSPKRAETLAANQIVLSLDSAPISGNSLIAAIFVRQAGVINHVLSIVQTNVTWVKQVDKDDGANLQTEIWRGIVGANADPNMTINLTNVADAAITQVSEWLLKGALDRTASANGNSINPDTGTTLATTLASELWIGATSTQANDPQLLPTNDFTLVDGVNVSGWGSIAFLYKIVAATGAANTGTTILINTWCGCIATFKSI